eukprot:1568866-Rhodomonas_salina.1
MTRKSSLEFLVRLAATVTIGRINCRQLAAAVPELVSASGVQHETALSESDALFGLPAAEQWGFTSGNRASAT